MSKPKILFVTTDVELCKTVQSGLDQEFSITCLDNAEEGLQLLGKDPRFVAVVSGLRLPGMNGKDFLTRVRGVHPKLVRLMISGDCDLKVATEVVNEARVAHLLTKPCSVDEIYDVLAEADLEYQQAQMESNARRETLLGCVKMLVDILELTNPLAARRSKRILRRARRICAELRALPPQMMDMAVLLSNVGCVGLPSSLLKKMETGEDMTPQEKKTFSTHPSIAAHLLGNVPSMSKLSNIIRSQNVPCAKQPPMASRILKVCIDMDRMQDSGATPGQALKFMQSKPEVYDERVVAAMVRHRQESDKIQCTPIPVAKLEPGMVMQEDMVTEKGAVLLNRGETLSEASHLRIQAFADLLRIKEPICAFMPRSNEAKAS